MHLYFGCGAILRNLENTFLFICGALLTCFALKVKLHNLHSCPAKYEMFVFSEKTCIFMLYPVIGNRSHKMWIFDLGTDG